MIVDSHCHLDILPADVLGSVEEIIQRAHEHGVERILCVAIDPPSWQNVLDLADQYPGVYASIGVHPCRDENTVVTDEYLLQMASHPKVIAIGEVGLDHYHLKPTEVDLSYQDARFRQHIRIAKQLNKPLIIHTRCSTPHVMQILREEGAKQVGGIMHCFVDDLATAEQALDMGFYISFSGIVTFKNAIAIKAVAQAVPLNRLLVETDAPYLAPMPYRGKINQPAYTRYVVEEIAKLRNLPFKTVAHATTENFNRLFGLPS